MPFEGGGRPLNRLKQAGQSGLELVKLRVGGLESGREPSNRLLSLRIVDRVLDAVGSIGHGFNLSYRKMVTGITGVGRGPQPERHTPDGITESDDPGTADRGAPRRRPE